MKLPIELFIQSINEKKVYYFSSSKINTQIPHYFICILINNKILTLVCCTSDRDDKRKKRIEKLGLHSTLVWIKPDTNNGLVKDSFVDCNSFFEYSIEDFKLMYENNLLEYKGEITDTHYLQIVQGLIDSPTIPMDVKELLKSKII